MLQYDAHTHTCFSDGKDTIADMLNQAVKLELSAVAITDHFDPNDPKAEISQLDSKMLAAHFAKIKRLAESLPIKVLCGVETTPFPDGKLALDDETAARCDLIITSCHYIPYEGTITVGDYFNDRYWGCFQEVLLAMALGEGTILGHSEDYLPIKAMIEGLNTTFAQRREICREIADRYLDRHFIQKLTVNLKQSGKACELHCETETPRGWVIDYMSRNGVIFSPGSDAHSVRHIGKVQFAFQMAERYGLKLLTL